jgi:protein gp37
VATPAAVRFLSLEPLLSGVSLRAWLTDADGVWCNTGKISWCIVGGESGPKARPMLPRWVDSLRRQCEESETPFFFKQWGAWRPAEHRCEPQSDLVDYLAVERCEASDMVWVGKAAAGAMLHGREWRSFPKPMQTGTAP